METATRLDTHVLTMIILVILAIFNMWRIVVSMNIIRRLQGLTSGLTKCTAPDACGKTKICQFIDGIKAAFEPWKQFTFAAIALVGTLVIALVTLVFPPEEPWPTISYLIRGFAVGLQLVTALVTAYLSIQLKKIVPVV
ncbi:MAG: hypothetical protein ACKVRP_00365 [Bacteroidota bacterium]